MMHHEDYFRRYYNEICDDPNEVDYLVWREVCDIEREVHELTANCCAQMAALDAWYADAELNGYRRR